MSGDDSRADRLRELAGQLLDLATREEEPGPLKRRSPVAIHPGLSASPEALQAIARGLLQFRRRREAQFGSDMFGEPAWDMLLELFVEALDGRDVPLTSLAIGTNVPPTTAIRWVELLKRRGLVARHESPADRRVHLLGLTRSTKTALADFLAEEFLSAPSKPFMLQHKRAK